MSSEKGKIEGSGNYDGWMKRRQYLDNAANEENCQM